MTLTLEVDNLLYPDLIALSATAALDQFVRTFSFTMAADIFYDALFGLGSSVIVKADGVPIVTGFLDSSNQSYNSESDTVTVKGRSKTQDLVDSTIGNDIQFDGQVNLKTVAEKMVASLFEFTTAPITPLKVIIEKGVDDFLVNEELNEEPGQTYFDVLEKFARKRQVLLTDNGRGDIVFTRGRGQEASEEVLQFSLRNVINGANNNIKSALRFDDDSERFNFYNANSQPTSGTLDDIAVIQPSGLVTGNGSVFDIGIRASRRFIFIPENASDTKEAINRAFWQANVKLAKASVYTATVSGHSQAVKTKDIVTGQTVINRREIWQPNNSVTVEDVKARIPDNRNTGHLLINTVQYTQNNSTGAQSVITCIPDFAYNLDSVTDFIFLPIGPS